MTQSDFFGAVESNLREQVASHMPLPEYNLPAFLRGDGHLRLVRGMVKLKSLKKLTSRDSSAPAMDPLISVADGVPCDGWNRR